MDPAGIREIYLVRPYQSNPYQFEGICAALPFKTRIRGVYGVNPWLPLSEPLTQRVSRHSEGFAGWLQYDCTVLAGVDLEATTERDVQNVRSAVERGLPIFVCGGEFGLGNSYRLWHDIDDALPARVPPGQPVEHKATVAAGADHPILRGLPRSFGAVEALHPLEVHDDAQVILAAGGMPVLVASERFGGRQLILAVAKAEGLCCDGLKLDGFYGHPFYPDLIRACFRWLMKVEPPLWIDSLSVGTEPNGQAAIETGVAQTPINAGAVLRCRLFATDEARLASGGDSRATELLAEEVRPIPTTRREETFAVRDLLAGRCSGLYAVELSLEMDDPPRTPPPANFAMSMSPEWNNWKGRAVDGRRFWLRFPDRRKARVFVPGRTFTLQESRPWRLEVAAPDLEHSRLEIADEAGRRVGLVESGQGGGPHPDVRRDGIGDPYRHELLWPAPLLVEGDYLARLRVQRGGVSEEFSFALKAVAPAPVDENFHLVTHGIDGGGSDADVLASIRANFAEFGLDTVNLPVSKIAQAVWDDSVAWADEPFARRRARWIDALVAAEGMYLWGDFDSSLVLLATHGAAEEKAPTRPCVHHPSYEAAARNKFQPWLRLMTQRAGLISTEIIDEPHLYPSNLCRCEICRRMYRQRFGEEMPSWEEVRGDTTARRWHLFQWLEDYTTAAFALTRKLKEEVAPALHLHNTAIDRLFSSNFMFNGMHRWAKYGDELYMACYPWSYAAWRGHKHVPHSQTHWIAAWIRGLARHYGIPWGVFMELWEHDTPTRSMPPYWSVSQFYSLLAEGADRMDTFLVSFGIEVFGMSLERLREFGREIAKVRPFFPLLPRTRRPRARMAFVNPWGQWVMDPQKHYLPPDHEGYGYYRHYAIPFDKLYPSENRRMIAYELFHRLFGDVDQVDEQLMCEAPMDYAAIVVTDCNVLMRDTAEKLSDFVRRGGALILDCAPSRDECGGSLDGDPQSRCVGIGGPFLASLGLGKPARSGAIVPGLSYELFECGSGKVLRFSASLQTAYADAIEGEQAGIRERLESTVASLLDELGPPLISRCLSSSGDIDAGLRLGDGVCLVPVANTSPDRKSATVSLRELPFEPAFAVNLTDGAFVTVDKAGDAHRLHVELEAYHGALYGLFPSRPASCGVSVSTGQVRAGEELIYEVKLTGDPNPDVSGLGIPTDGGAPGTPVKGELVVHVSVDDGAGRRHRRLGGPVIVKDGRATVRRRLPVNARAGAWRLRVEEPILGLTATTEFAVVE